MLPSKAARGTPRDSRRRGGIIRKIKEDAHFIIFQPPALYSPPCLSARNPPILKHLGPNRTLVFGRVGGEKGRGTVLSYWGNWYLAGKLDDRMPEKNGEGKGHF